MANFFYKAYDKSGSIVDGDIDGLTIEHAKNKINELGYYLVSIEIKNATNKTSLFESKKLTLNELEFVTAELSLLLKSGVKIDRCLQILSRGKSSSAVQILFIELYKSVKKGETLSEAFAAFPDFDNLYINLIKMGEESGELAEVFEGLANDLQYRKELKSRIIQSVTYPSVILFVCIIAILFVFNFIVPQMSGLFEESDDLPFYTEMLLNLSAWMQDYQFYLLFSIVIGIVIFLFLIKKQSVKEWLDVNLLKLPIVKEAIYKVERIRFNTSMALMITSGVQIDKAIELSAFSIKNIILKKHLLKAKDKVKKGMSLTDAFQGSPIYPDFLLSLVEVGEEAGSLSIVFGDIAQRSRKEFESWTTKITNLLEPLMILFMGGIVGSVVVVMLLSIIAVNDTF